MALNALISDQRRGGSRGEPAVLVDPVRLPVPALSRSGAMGHKSTLPQRPRQLQVPLTRPSRRVSAETHHAIASGVVSTGINPRGQVRSSLDGSHLTRRMGAVPVLGGIWEIAF